MNNNIYEHVPGRVISSTNILNKDECNKLIVEAELAGFKPSPKSGGGHGQVPSTGARTSQFYVKDNVELATKIWSRVYNAVPINLHNIKPVPYMNSQTRGDEYSPIGINEHMRFYKYDPGQCILKHDDYRMSRFRYDITTDKYYQQMTFLTLLVYLNEEFDNGRTLFWSKYANGETKGHCRFLRDVDTEDADLAINPITGMGLISDHVIQHEGEAPAKGTKYILRTDILHERNVNKINVTDKFKKGQVLSEWTRHYEPSCLHYTE
jgi:prolyl 4-hydroxylase